jgi:hypothetical protein
MLCPCISSTLRQIWLKKNNDIFRKAYKWHLTKKVYEIEDIAEVIQMKLFQQSKLSNHYLNHFCVPKIRTVT